MAHDSIRVRPQTFRLLAKLVKKTDLPRTVIVQRAVAEYAKAEEALQGTDALAHASKSTNTTN